MQVKENNFIITSASVVKKVSAENLFLAILLSFKSSSYEINQQPPLKQGVKGNGLPVSKQSS